ncbi:MAG: copper resistance protein CopC [Chromatiales bacterium]|nr:copper resistance protein CopC [Chromatiales bacterium]
MKHCDKRIHRGPALVPVLAVLASGTAFAHSKQEVTFPADGAVLSASPDVVSMRFDMPMRVTLIRLTSETTGGTFELARSDGMRPVTDFRATPPVLPHDRYTVEWRGLSTDGHAMQCRFSFEVAK